MHVAQMQKHSKESVLFGVIYSVKDEDPDSLS